jgi:ATP sulfurylase
MRYANLVKLFPRLDSGKKLAAPTLIVGDHAGVGDYYGTYDASNNTL